MDNKPKDAFNGGKADPLLKEIYNDKVKRTKTKDKRRFSKIRNIIKNQKKSK